MSQTLTTIRQEVARRATEFLQGTATGGSTTSVVDTVNLNQDDDFWGEAWVRFSSGTNNDAVRRVSASSQSAASLTLYSAAPASVGAGDTYDLHRRFSPVDIMNGVNSAVNKSWPDFFETVKSNVVTATTNTFRYDFPAGVPEEGVIGIEMQILTDPNVPTYPYERLPISKYDIIREWDGSANAEKLILELRFNPQTNRLIRFLYAKPLQAVTTSTDRIHLDAPHLEWLYTQTIADMWRAEASRSADIARQDAKDQLQFWEEEEKKMRNRLRFRKEAQQLDKTTWDVYSVWRDD
jgi:hypothetical protein